MESGGPCRIRTYVLQINSLPLNLLANGPSQAYIVFFLFLSLFSVQLIRSYRVVDTALQLLNKCNTRRFTYFSTQEFMEMQII